MFLKHKYLAFFIISLHTSVQIYSQTADRGSMNIPMQINGESTFLNDTLTTEFQVCIAPFVELLGKGFISLNVDFRIRESYALSIGIQPMEGLLPDIMFYHFIGKLRRFETGGGFSLGFSNELKLGVVLLHGVLGYRYQKNKGIFFRVGFTPLYVMFLNDLERDNKFYPFVGLSLGYSF